MRSSVIGTALTCVLLLGACASGGDAPVASTAPSSSTPTALPATPTSAAPTPTATASPVDTATPDPSTSPTSAAPTAAPLVDFGAVLSVWAAHHTADERFDPGAMWDATTGWGPDEANNDKFNSVVLTGGRVLDYVMYLPRPSVPQAKATVIALATLPKDASVLWKQQLAGCSVVQLTSASLAKVVAGNPRGQVQLVLLSGSALAPSAAFDPGKVGSVHVRATQAATPADFAGC